MHLTRNRLAARLRREDGFTLVEMLVACVIGTVVMGAAFMILDLANGLSQSVDARVDTTSRARTAMEQVTRELRSQVCLQPGTAAITNGQDNSVTFYTYLGGPTGYSPERHTITWNPATRELTDYAFVGTGTPPNMTYPATATRTNTLLSNVDPVGTTPIFSYYTWTASGTVSPTVALATPLSAAGAQATVRIAVQFKVSPSGNAHPTVNQTTILQNDVFVRTADPNAAGAPGLPDCG
jgi:prepilin-type N-terminal cleavage/methylation domain-containing protein